jgi:hypothetical protein
MVERLVEQKQAINYYIVEQNPDSLQIITKKDEDLMEDFIRLLKPLKLFTNDLSGDKYPTLALVLPSVTKLYVDIGVISAKPEIKVFKNDLLKCIKNRFNDLFTDRLYSNSTLLDPSKLYFFYLFLYKYIKKL